MKAVIVAVGNECTLTCLDLQQNPWPLCIQNGEIGPPISVPPAALPRVESASCR